MFIRNVGVWLTVNCGKAVVIGNSIDDRAEIKRKDIGQTF